MKILFYNPAPSQRRCTPFEALRGSPFFRRPNYDAMRLSYLSRRHDFIYVDEHIETCPDIEPDMIVMHTPLNLARYVKNLIGSKWEREVPTVCYGSYATMFPAQTKEFCTSVVTGDIAAPWKTILADIRKARLAPLYSGDRVKHFDADRRIETKFGFTPFFSQIRTSYGCGCKDEHRDYCYESVQYRNPARWSIERAAESVARSKRKAILVLDDDFLSNIDHGMRILERCWRYKKMWTFQTTGKIFSHTDLFARLRDDGVRIIYLKEDWLNRNIIDNLDNKEFVKEKEHQVSALHNYRITVGSKIRLGYPGEDQHFYERLLKFLIKLRIDIIELAVQTPLPGTKTHEDYRAREQVAQDLTLYDQWMPVVNTPGVAPQALYSTMEWLRDRFYSWDSILQRNIIVSPRLGFYNTFFFYLIPNLSYRSNFLEKVGYPP
ncbi:MAG: hypothetical protein JSW49_09485 [candidate division WOR-3 bacterium]|nr:MAG: hypothetical protein JSW49_09485 [candidate division WOR-3 bacterium]